MIELLAFLAAQAAAPQIQRVVMHTPKPPGISGADTCLSLKLADLMPVIPASVGGKPVNLAFDTGAPGGPILDPAIIEELKLEKVGEVRMSDPSLKNVITAGRYGISDLKIGNLTVAKWEASARPPRPNSRLYEPDGVIGLTAFSGYVVTIDYPGGRILITKGRLPEPDNRTSFRYEGPIPRVPLTLDGKEIEAHIDTGNARYGLILPDSYAAQLPGYASRYPIGVARTVNNKFELMAVPVRESRVGALDLHAGTAAYPSPARTGNLGSTLLRDMIVKVDPANSIVALERARPGLENGCPSA
jgi:hypothetical protein